MKFISDKKQNFQSWDCSGSAGFSGFPNWRTLDSWNFGCLLFSHCYSQSKLALKVTLKECNEGVPGEIL